MTTEEHELLRRIAQRASEYFRAKHDFSYARQRTVCGVKKCHERMQSAVVDWENYMANKET